MSLGGGASRQCFYDLTPSSQYQISVHTQLQEMEGPSVSVTDMTSMLQMFHIPPKFIWVSSDLFSFLINIIKRLTNPFVLMFVWPISRLVLYFSICLLCSQAVSAPQLSVLQFLFFFWLSLSVLSLSEKTVASTTIMRWSSDMDHSWAPQFLLFTGICHNHRPTKMLKQQS